MDAGVINNRIKVETEHTEQGVFWKEIIKKGLPYLMIAPTMAVSLVFLVYPILYMIKLGFYKWNMVGEMKFIGLDNYRALMTDPEFLQVLKTPVSSLSGR